MGNFSGLGLMLFLVLSLAVISPTLATEECCDCGRSSCNGPDSGNCDVQGSTPDGCDSDNDYCRAYCFPESEDDDTETDSGDDENETDSGDDTDCCDCSRSSCNGPDSGNCDVQGSTPDGCDNDNDYCRAYCFPESEDDDTETDSGDDVYGECCECDRSSCSPGDGLGNCNTQGQPSDTCKDEGFNDNKNMCRDWCGGNSTNSTGNLTMIETSATFMIETSPTPAPSNTTEIFVETTAPFAPVPTVPSPVITATGSVSADGTYYNIAELTITSISGSSIVYGTEKANLNCSAASEGNETTITLTQSTALYAIACNDGIASAVSNDTFGVTAGIVITIEFSLDLDINNISDSVKSNIGAALAAKFNVKPSQIVLTFVAAGGRRLLAVSVSAAVYPSSEEEASAAKTTADDLDLAAITDIVQNADPSLKNVGVSGLTVATTGTTQTTTTPAAVVLPEEEEDDSVNAGLIAGVTVAAVAVVAAVIGGVFYVKQAGAAQAARDLEPGPVQAKAETLPNVYYQPPAQSPPQYVQPNLYDSVTPLTGPPGYVQPGGLILLT